jgi:hypothetical protein
MKLKRKLLNKIRKRIYREELVFRSLCRNTILIELVLRWMMLAQPDRQRNLQDCVPTLKLIELVATVTGKENDKNSFLEYKGSGCYWKTQPIERVEKYS